MPEGATELKLERPLLFARAQFPDPDMFRAAHFQTGLIPVILAILFSGNALADNGEFHLGPPPGHPIVKEGFPPGTSVGYVNTVVVSGWNLLENPLDDESGNLIGGVLKTVSPGTVVIKPTAQGWVANNYINGWSRPDLALAPGEGFFILSPSNTTLTFAGQLPSGIFVSHLPVGDCLVGSQLPGSGPLTGTVLRFPAKTGDRVTRLRAGSSVFDSFSFDGTWHPEEPKLIPSDAFWLHQEQAADWRLTFSFEGLPVPPDAPVVEEVSPAAIAGTGGLVDFFTYGPGSRIYASDGVTPLDSQFVAQLWAAVDSGYLTPVTAPIPFGDGPAAGWIDGGLVTLPAEVEGQVIGMQILCWPKAAGSAYNTAFNARAEVGISETFYCKIGVPDAPGILPGITTGFASFRVVRPKLQALYCVLAGGELELRWPSAWADRPVQSAPRPEGPWFDLTAAVVLEDDEKVIRISPEETTRFFQLQPLPY